MTPITDEQIDELYYIAKCQSYRWCYAGFHISKEDLEQEGVLAGWEAFPRYDPNLDLGSFKGFMWPLVRGAMIAVVQKEYKLLYGVTTRSVRRNPDKYANMSKRLFNSMDGERYKEMVDGLQVIKIADNLDVVEQLELVKKDLNKMDWAVLMGGWGWSLKQGEIAKALRSTVSRVAKARNRLRKRFPKLTDRSFTREPLTFYTPTELAEALR